ncbi:alginate lyase family protein [Primorskyibacter aestuariivivens]|uniref:alginate lyase family protein n=1 Tax=Primorskyibacter aestuariivivens TaxID=1888912 RepID=UPI0022FFF0B6|nr:alginate lyase family protein [Primorskyibacter aestuariivivens]MDA7430838.1 alginate lyase family protein [Primorskyibacter aestuariivivens]
MMKRSVAMTCLTVFVLGLTAERAVAFECPATPEPVLTMEYDSRYEEDDDTRSEIDEDANDAVNASQKPVDDFIRLLADSANRIFDEGADQGAIADCVVAQVAEWARRDALLDLRTDTVRLTFGSRLAGISLALRQVVGHGGTSDDWQAIRSWLRTLSTAQLEFWEQEATSGAKRGNLRAWAALGIAAAADLLDDPVLHGWSAWSTRYVLCSANPDGSLPQEMRRGRLALHYQLHAVAPLVVTTRLLADRGYSLQDDCEAALMRVVTFTLADVETGERTQDITGETQTFFDGSAEISAYHLAWLEAFISLVPAAPEAQEKAAQYRPLSSSKLGGEQTHLW